MKHLVRPGVILVILLSVLIMLRLMPVSATMEPYGFYRGTNNEGEWAAQPIHYADIPACGDCHQDRHDTWAMSKHGTVSCENCHGPTQVHLEKGMTPVVDTSRDQCGSCHSELPARPSHFPQVNMEEHGEQSPCIACHDPHEPQIGGFPPIPHDLEGRTNCLSCHNIEGIKPFPVDHEGRSNETCQNCHRSK